MVLATFSETPPVVLATCIAGVVLLLIGAWAARKEIAQARGADRIVALGSLCIAIPLAVFGAEHLFGVELVVDAVPTFMPWHLFWAYFVPGRSLLVAASLSIRPRVDCGTLVSSPLPGLVMFLFVADDPIFPRRWPTRRIGFSGS